MSTWRTIARRLDQISENVPRPQRDLEIHFDRLTPEQAERADRLRARLWDVGPDGLTPDEMMEAADLHRVLTGEKDK